MFLVQHKARAGHLVIEIVESACAWMYKPIFAICQDALPIVNTLHHNCEIHESQDATPILTRTHPGAPDRLSIGGSRNSLQLTRLGIAWPHNARRQASALLVRISTAPSSL